VVPFSASVTWRCPLFFDVPWPVPVVRDCASDGFCEAKTWRGTVFDSCMRCYLLPVALIHARARFAELGKARVNSIFRGWDARPLVTLLNFRSMFLGSARVKVGRSILPLMLAVRVCDFVICFSRKGDDVQSLGEALPTAAHSMEIPKGRQFTTVGAECLEMHGRGVRDHRARRHTPVLSFAKEGGQVRANRKSVS
jgi:hypothetical protein